MAFTSDSRYADVPTRQIVRDGRTVVFVGIRRIPATQTLFTHEVVAGERYDHIANEYLGSPEQFWRIADANYNFDPNELTASPGRRVIIPRER